MQYYSNELHQGNKIAGLDNSDIVVVGAMYGIITISSWYLLFVFIPLFFYYKQIKKSQNRGFIRHFFYSTQLEKIKNYPKPNELTFYQ